MSAIQSNQFKKALFTLLDEIFDDVHGLCLDKNTSLFETLASLTADEASIPVGGKCSTLAAQVKHISFYLDFVDRSVRNPGSLKADWGEVWRTISQVTPEEWQSVQDELRANYIRILGLIENNLEWPSEKEISSAIAVIVHTAYHLGEIRQALCILRP